MLKSVSPARSRPRAAQHSLVVAYDRRVAFKPDWTLVRDVVVCSLRHSRSALAAANVVALIRSPHPGSPLCQISSVCKSVVGREAS